MAAKTLRVVTGVVIGTVHRLSRGACRRAARRGANPDGGRRLTGEPSTTLFRRGYGNWIGLPRGIMETRRLPTGIIPTQMSTQGVSETNGGHAHGGTHTQGSFAAVWN